MSGKIKKIFVIFYGKPKTSKNHSEINWPLLKSKKSSEKCQSSKTSNRQDPTFPSLSLKNMIVLDEWTNSDSEQKKEIPVEIEPQIIDQNKSTEQLRESMNDLFRSFEDM